MILLFTATFSFSDSIINDIDHFSKLFPRSEGSPNEKETIAQIAERLQALDVDFQEFGFTETEGYHSYSSYIEAVIPGIINDSIVSVIPVEGSYGISAALFLIEYYKTISPQLTLKFIFLGAESTGGNKLGTRNFLEHFYPESPAAFIYLNFEGIPQSFRISSGADGFSTPFFLFDTVKDSLDSAGIDWVHSNTESILFRLSAAGTDSGIRDYLEDGYPAIELNCDELCGESYESIVDETELKNFYTTVLDEFSAGIPSDWDSHYIFGISEQIFLLLYILLLALLMIYPIFRRKHFGWYMKTLLKNFWSLPFLFGSVFIILSLTSLLLTFILAKMGFMDLWKYRSLTVFLFKISFSLLIYTLAFKLISKLPFSKKGSFYSISAIFFLVISLFILTVINLSLSFFALWSLCFIFLLTVFRKPVIKLIMLLLSVIWLGFILFEIFSLPSLSVIELITLSPLYGDLLISIIIMPFILAAIRLELLSPLSGKLTRLLPALLGAASAGLLVVILFFSPFNEMRPQPVNITETIDENNDSRKLEIDSPHRLPEDVRAKITEIVEAAPEFTEKTELALQTKSFLNRKIINTEINFADRPEKISFTLYSDEPLTLYDSNYPAEWLPGQKKLEVFIGSNPPLPLNISLTLNRTAEAMYSIQADFPASSTIIKYDNESYMISHRVSIVNNYSYED